MEQGRRPGKRRAPGASPCLTAAPLWRIRVTSLTPALILNDYGCFVPDLTRFTAEPCEGARHGGFYQVCGRAVDQGGATLAG